MGTLAKLLAAWNAAYFSIFKTDKIHFCSITYSSYSLVESLCRSATNCTTWSRKCCARLASSSFSCEQSRQNRLRGAVTRSLIISALRFSYLIIICKKITQIISLIHSHHFQASLFNADITKKCTIKAAVSWIKVSNSQSSFTFIQSLYYSQKGRARKCDR